MTYKNGKDILPVSLLKKIQEHIDGQLIYIPTKKHHKAKWGEKSGSREYLRQRNNDIYSLYKEGYKIDEIATLYHLSNESIKKIVYNFIDKK